MRSKKLLLMLLSSLFIAGCGSGLISDLSLSDIISGTTEVTSIDSETTTAPSNNTTGTSETTTTPSGEVTSTPTVSTPTNPPVTSTSTTPPSSTATNPTSTSINPTSTPPDSTNTTPSSDTTPKPEIINFDTGNFSLYVGNSKTITASILPEDASQEVEWSTSNSAVATVSSGGVVLGKATGTAVITATAVANRNKTKSVTVSVSVEYIYVTDITIDGEEYLEALVGSTYQLNATISPSNATNNGIVWTSDDQDSATVSSTGLVTFHQDGMPVITATSAENEDIYAEVIFDVTYPIATSVVINGADTIDLEQGRVQQLSVNVEPQYAQVSFSSSDPAAVTVTQDGIIKAVGDVGSSAEITARGTETITDSITVTVSAAAAKTSVTLTANGLSTEYTSDEIDVRDSKNHLFTFGYTNVLKSTDNTAGAGRAGTLQVKGSNEGSIYNVTAKALAKLQITYADVAAPDNYGDDYISVYGGPTTNNMREYELADFEGDDLVYEFDYGTNFFKLVAKSVQYYPQIQLFYDYEQTAAESVTIATPPTSSLEAGRTVQLSATVGPVEAEQVISWSSSDEDVATVDANGLVTGVAAGSVTITATATGFSVYDTVDLTIIAPRETVTASYVYTHFTASYSSLENTATYTEASRDTKIQYQRIMQQNSCIQMERYNGKIYNNEQNPMALSALKITYGGNYKNAYTVKAGVWPTVLKTVTAPEETGDVRTFTFNPVTDFFFSITVDDAAVSLASIELTIDTTVVNPTEPPIPNNHPYFDLNTNTLTYDFTTLTTTSTTKYDTTGIGDLLNSYANTADAIAPVRFSASVSSTNYIYPGVQTAPANAGPANGKTAGFIRVGNNGKIVWSYGAGVEVIAIKIYCHTINAETSPSSYALNDVTATPDATNGANWVANVFDFSESPIEGNITLQAGNGSSYQFYIGKIEVTFTETSINPVA